MATGAELVTLILQGFGDRTDKDTEALQDLNDTIAEMVTDPRYRFRALEDSGTFVTVDGTYAYSLPSDFETLYAMKLKDGDIYKTITEVTGAERHKLFTTVETEDSGVPDKCFVWGESDFVLQPTPDDVWTVYYYYYKGFTAITSTQTPVFGDTYNHIMVAGAKAKLFANMQEPDDANQWEARFQRAMVLKHRSERRSGARPRLPLAEKYTNLDILGVSGDPSTTLSYKNGTHRRSTTMAWPTQTELWSTVETIDGSVITHSQIDEIFEYIAGVLTTAMAREHGWGSATAGNAATRGIHAAGVASVLKQCATADVPASPGTGGVLYDTDKEQLLGYNGSAWKRLCGGSPFMAVSLSADQTLSAVTWEKIEWDTEEHDVGGTLFDSATNHRWVPDVAGMYLLGASARFVSPVDQELCGVRIYKNNANAASGLRNVGSNSNQEVSIVSLLEADGSTDYFETFAYRTNSGDIDSTAALTRFWGHLVSPIL